MKSFQKPDGNKKDYPKEINVIPTQSGNGFIKGKTYTAYHIQNGLYVVTIGLAEKIFSYPVEGLLSPHLWGGRNADEMGEFKLVS